MVAENQPGHIDQIKQTNAGAVYRLIDQLGPVSRIDLSRLAQLAPAGFLVFGAHHIIIILLQDSGWISCKGWLWDVTWLVLVPAIYAIICAVFFLIRKYAPALLPYVAGYRVKPAQRA